jgi:hypothetical protein
VLLHYRLLRSTVEYTGRWIPSKLHARHANYDSIARLYLGSNSWLQSNQELGLRSEVSNVACNIQSEVGLQAHSNFPLSQKSKSPTSLRVDYGAGYEAPLAANQDSFHSGMT